MQRVDRLFADYAAAHRNGANIVTHWIGIPMIIYGIIALLLPMGVPWLNAALAAMALAAGYWFWLDWRLGAGMVVALGVLAAPAYLLADWRIGLVAFLVGWGFQALGHAAFEKRSPSFLSNLLHLLTGPLFLLNKLMRVRPVEPDAHPDQPSPDAA